MLGLMAERLRYCQRCHRSQVLWDRESPKPCMSCGGVNFENEPKKHTLVSGFQPIKEDETFLWVQRIKPEREF